MECCIEMLSSGYKCITSVALNTHTMANYSQHGRLPGERAGKQGSFLRDFCELVERDKLETTTILDWNGRVLFW